jgi:acetyl-CoA acetyltransferase family protein
VGDAQAVVAGGVESMTRAPLSLPKPDVAFPTGNATAYDTTLGWRYPNPRMEARFPLESMGQTAENVAERYAIARRAQDELSLRSHQRAVAAHTEGRFSAELLPVSVALGKGESALVDRDEGPRADTSLETLAKLAPVFKGGSVTAGNSSSLNDGAAALLITSEAFAKSRGLTPMARVVAAASAGVDPRFMGMGPVPATEMVLARAGLRAEDLDLIEINEAFAAQSLACIQLLGLDPERVNVNGGAIALGHPLGCSGARILTTLAHELVRRQGRYGLATLCVGVGQGTAVIIERV